MEHTRGFDSDEPAAMQIEDTFASAEPVALLSLALRASGLYKYVRRIPVSIPPAIPALVTPAPGEDRKRVEKTSPKKLRQAIGMAGARS